MPEKKDTAKGQEKAGIKQVHNFSDKADTVDKVGVEILTKK